MDDPDYAGLLRSRRAEVGQRIREIRDGLAYSQEELSGRSGLHSSYIGGVERGDRNASLNNLIALADALDTDLAEFFLPSPPVVT